MIWMRIENAMKSRQLPLRVQLDHLTRLSSPVRDTSIIAALCHPDNTKVLDKLTTFLITTYTNLLHIQAHLSPSIKTNICFQELSLLHSEDSMRKFMEAGHVMGRENSVLDYSQEETINKRWNHR